MHGLQSGHSLFSLVMNNRDHRKILDIDGHTAYTGGINLADEYINEIVRFGLLEGYRRAPPWRGCLELYVMFLEMWNAFRKRMRTSTASASRVASGSLSRERDWFSLIRILRWITRRSQRTYIWTFCIRRKVCLHFYALSDRGRCDEKCPVPGGKAGRGHPDRDTGNPG